MKANMKDPAMPKSPVARSSSETEAPPALAPRSEALTSGGQSTTSIGRIQPMSDKDWALILESLNYTRKVFQEYPNYPSYDFRMEKLAEVDAVIGKVRQLRKGMR